jgi:uncharacterized membrane protein
MSETDFATLEDKDRAGKRSVMHVLYGMHTVAPFTLWSLSLVALLVHYVKRSDEAEPLYVGAPHVHDPHRVGDAAGAGDHLSPVVPAVPAGGIAYTLIGAWYLYRLPARLAALQRQPLPGVREALAMNHDPDCIFCKIAAGRIPSEKVYEDEEILAFHDIHPWAPVHFLLVPKEHIVSMAHVETGHAAMLGKLLSLVPGWRSRKAAGPIRGRLPRGLQHRRGRRPGSAPPAFPRHRRPAPVAEGLRRPRTG